MLKTRLAAIGRKSGPAAAAPLADSALHWHKGLEGSRFVLTVGNRVFEIVRGSDINRDGMYLEMSEQGGKAGIAEVFYSDQTGAFVLNTFGNDIPLEAIEWIAANARSTLPA